MTPRELQACYETLGLESGVDVDAANRAFLRQSLALIQRGASEDEKQRLKECHAALVAWLEQHRLEGEALASGVAEGQRVTSASDAGTACIAIEPNERADRAERSLAFWLDVAGAPLVVLLAIGIRLSPLGFLLQGFHVWVHEFGHATVAWLTGHRALPLPIGWTNIAPEKSLFVYFGVLFLLGVLAVAGWRERKPAAVAVALGLAGIQAYCTWVLPQHEAEKWIAFAGVGGEFYLSSAMMAAFFFQLPEKFRWEICRWIFLFLGAASFSQTYGFWRAIAAGREGIPWGSMIGGEDDASGDMDTLRDDFHWTEHQIVGGYNSLGTGCLIALVVCYVGAIGLRWMEARRADV